MKSEEYWKERTLLVENENFKNTEYHLQKMKEQYETARLDIQKEIDKFYDDFAINNQVQLLDAKKILDNNELKEFKTSLKQYKRMVELDNEELLQKINNISIKHRITRMQALQEKINIILKQLDNGVAQELNNTLIENAENSYYQGIYEIESRLGIHTDFSIFDTKIADSILRYNWSGVVYSERLWRNQAGLKQSLKDALNKNFIQGNSINQLAAEMSKSLDTSYSNCTRLLRTEVNYANNKSAIEGYKEKEIKKYVFVATLDLKTSEICSETDGKIFDVDKMVVGVNCPPLHPNCRSTIAPYIEGLERNRVARNVKTGEIEEVGDLSYEEWYKKYVEDRYSKEEIDSLKKRFMNFSSDKMQYARYKQILGTDLRAERFDKFQDLKYNDIEEWKLTKYNYKLLNEVKRNPGVVLKEANNISIDENKYTHYLFDSKSTKGYPKGQAITSRLGYDASNYQEFDELIKSKIGKYPARHKGKNSYGDKYEVNMILRGITGKQAKVKVGIMQDESKTWVSTIHIDKLKGSDLRYDL